MANESDEVCMDYEYSRGQKRWCTFAHFIMSYSSNCACAVTSSNICTLDDHLTISNRDVVAYYQEQKNCRIVTLTELGNKG